MNAIEEVDYLRKRFTDNAKEFDSLMVLMLAENKKLLKQLKAAEKVVDAVAKFRTEIAPCPPRFELHCASRRVLEALKEYDLMREVPRG